MEDRDLGKYQLVAELARGGMGIVYLAVVKGPAGFSKLLVVKVLKPELIEDSVFLTMFLDEARLAAHLNHRNIVQTYEMGEHDQRYFLAMEHLDGQPLFRVLRRFWRTTPLPLGMHVRVLAEALSGLHYAHELTTFEGSPLGIVHRDVSPSNIFITFDGQVKLVDFGVASAVGRLQDDTRAGVLKGRVGYMAPEQARGERVDRRADIHAVGVLLWEALAGRRLWAGKTDMEALRALYAREATPPPADAPPELARICAKAMDPERERRYATADEMRADLESYLTATRDRSSVAEIGALVGRAFADERARARAVLEAELAYLATGSPRPRPVSLGVTSRASSPDFSRDGSPVVSMPPPTFSTSLSGSDRPPEPTPLLPPLSPARASSRWMFAAGGTAIAGAIIVASFALRPHAGATPVAAAAATSPPPPTPAVQTSIATAPAAIPPTSPAPAMVEVVIRASPASATLFLDGEAVEGNPFRASFPKSDTAHQIRAAAPGYRSKTESAAFESNITVSLGLEREAHVARPPRGPDRRPDASPAPASTDVDPQGGKLPYRPIDTASPYQQE